MNKSSLIIILLCVAFGVAIIFSLNSGPRKNISKNEQKVEIKNGVQYITINAGGGYYPRETIAKSGIPTKLIVKTNGTYDCSSALAIRSLGFQKILPQTGETEIDVGVPKAGEPLQGVCGMGMYSFNINFK